MTATEKQEYLMYFELEKFGETGIGKKRYSHEYNAFKDGWTLFLERGTRFSCQSLPQLCRNSVREGRTRIIKEYPDWYIDQENRRLEYVLAKSNRAEKQEKKIIITPKKRELLKRELDERMRLRRKKAEQRKKFYFK